MNSKQYLEGYLQIPLEKSRICTRCGRELRESDEYSLCGLCQYIEKYNILKQNKRRNINKELTTAGYTLRISSAQSNAYFRRNKWVTGVRFNNSKVIALNLKHIKDIAQKKARTEDFERFVAFTISHEFEHVLLERLENEETSKMFDSQWLKEKLQDYLGGVDLIRLNQTLIERFKADVRQTAMIEVWRAKHGS